MSPFYRTFSYFRDCYSAYLHLQHPQVYLVNWSPYHCKAMWENHPISANIYGYLQLPIAMRSKDNIRSKIIFEMMLSRLYIQNDNYEMKSANRFWKIWKNLCFTLIRSLRIAGETPLEYEFWSSKVLEGDHACDGICMSLQFLSTDFCSSLISKLGQICTLE